MLCTNSRVDLQSNMPLCFTTQVLIRNQSLESRNIQERDLNINFLQLGSGIYNTSQSQTSLLQVIRMQPLTPNTSEKSVKSKQMKEAPLLRGLAHPGKSLHQAVPELPSACKSRPSDRPDLWASGSEFKDFRNIRVHSSI